MLKRLKRYLVSEKEKFSFWKCNKFHKNYGVKFIHHDYYYDHLNRYYVCQISGRCGYCRKKLTLPFILEMNPDDHPSLLEIPRKRLIARV